jgi:hypothetical protein
MSEPVIPANLGKEWVSLGFDIADEWMCSGLSNCGYEGGERAG